ncbi:DUF1343 domain-containing protein [Stieleria sp. JC731]|uniref:exo-beta-N-acetylmuramidase NamZ family protein n=1 Tax=Pirellulaceae TaxID=2691357 RepID=UPI001E4374F8|nr:DUF1343 domain-containing protein [Stieleria sp. JC731]MCC9603900.1 DUF1343 domain-containing protein [Stieleria sp. JC731]
MIQEIGSTTRRSIVKWLCVLACLTGLPGFSAAQTPVAPIVHSGIDVLKQTDFKQLDGQRVGLISNHTGVDWQGNETAVLLHQAPNVDLVTLFSPEHGYHGQLDQSQIANDEDKSTGLKIISLYGATRRPTPEMLAEIDTIVFDIQDIGTRFYTYISTMGEAMLAANELGKRFVVLDRPNPIGGLKVAGPMLDPGTESFVGFHPLPIRHGMTIGELAKMFHTELGLTNQLEVIPCRGWDRSMPYDETGQVWINPSPNMRSLTQAFLYPGVGMLETSNLSVGRGTDTPFEVIGAPWIDPVHWAAELRKEPPLGVRFVPIRFVPNSSKYQGETCGGVNIVIVDRSAFEPIELGVVLAVTLQKLYSDEWKAKSANRLLGSKETMQAILDFQPTEMVMKSTTNGLELFLKRRAKFLLY